MIHPNKIILTFILICLLCISCTNLPYKKSLETFHDGKYAQAINELDQYILITKHPAYREKAKEMRSRAYYQLGLNEYKQDNFLEASEYLYLANSIEADSLLDNCYFEIAQSALNSKDYIRASEYLSFIIYHLQNSEMMSEVLYDEILIQTDYSDDIHAAYETYQTLQDQFSDSDALTRATQVVDIFMPVLIDEVRVLWNSNKYSQALDILNLYEKYPAGFLQIIRDMTGSVYYSWAVDLLNDGVLDDVQTYLLLAEEYNQELTQNVHDRLIELASIFIDRGDDLLANRQTDEAISSYNKTLNIIEDYEIARNRIARTEEFARKIAQAQKYVEQGNTQFENEEYTEAYDSYSEAYKFDSIPEIYDLIDLAYVWTRITNDPENFAIEIVKNYKDGIILSKINEIETLAQKEYSRQDIRITPWQVFRTVTQNSYEVRYTIVIPEINYFFRWLVRLETREVVPLNDTTEGLLAL